MVTYITSDLEFILEQIKIAEQHAAGAPLFGPGGLIPAPNIAWGLRTVDGTYNNILPGREHWGAADQEFPHLLEPDYREGEALPFDPDGPGPLTAGSPTSYTPSNDPNSLVFDSSLRTISNLIVDQTLNNPAAILEALSRAGLEGAEANAALADITAAFAALKALPDDDPGIPAAQALLDGLLAANGVEMSGTTIVLPNIAPDEGLSASFNSWFTLFGQFFDHGLDLVAKGNSGTVFIPLQPDDPLYDPASPTNFMVLTRATVSAGEDGLMGTPDDVGPINTTTPFVDQNQTYTSHPSHQVFLREYELVGGVPQATGRLLDGATGGLPNWGEVKAQAADILGIELTDYHVGNLPLLATDPYGNFIPDPITGFPQVVLAGPPESLASGTPGAPLNITPEEGGVQAVLTGHAFLDDIAHEAVPVGKIADGDIEIGLGNPGNGDTEYDDELLDAHFVTGDGRGNENIGLTSVHHVFHAEHNRLLEHTKAQVLATGDLEFINEWLDVEIDALPANQAEIDALDWNGERLFQAAKFGTEMQYQHLVFEEFARKIQPQIDAFLVPDGFDYTINPAIVAEFAHVVYRFGHSMLTESIDRFDPNFNPDHISLIEGFLNPVEFATSGTAAEVAGSIVRGMTRQLGNEIDEFVTDALRNNLLGLPLDLATINLARGRDTGVPSLNAARREFYEATDHAAELKPYESWTDFAGHLKNEAAIINFVAAYGLHPLIVAETTVEGKRDAAMTIITGTSFGGMLVPADRLDFLNGTGAWESGPDGVTITGLDNVDLWIGGLAEETMPFGGMLGSTFNFVFEMQMEHLQSGDRFYYLQRLDGLHLFGEMENNSFASMIMRNTNATHLPSDVFSTPGLILEVNQAVQYTGLGVDGRADPEGGTILTPLVIRDNPSTAGPDANYLRYTGGDHVVLGGTDNNDTLIAGIGDDTLYGDGGNDRLEGGFGNDIINGGAGDDIIRDSGGDDNIKAGDGNDVVHAGPGLDLVMGGAGKDFIVTGTDAGTEIFAGEGDDFILGNKTAERILGNEGSDWIETGTFDGAPGDNFDEIFARDGIDGHDVFLGDGGFDELIGEGGDDIMVGSGGRGKMVGMSGFDWATYKDNPFGVNADISLPIVFDESPILPENAALDEYESIEGLSGTQFDDVLRGTNDVAADRLPTSQGGTTGYLGSALTADGVARIAGLGDLLGDADTPFLAGDIILGGGGSDLIAGQAGNDVIDGDSWLNVRISVRANSDGTGAEIDTADSMHDLITEMFAGTYNAGQLVIVREILSGGQVGDIDTAVFSDLSENYDIVFNDDGSVTVIHARGTQIDGTDILHNMERAQFANETIDLVAPTGAIANNDAFVIDENDTLSAYLFGDNGFGLDEDLGGPPLTVAAVNGSAAAVGTTIELDSGALLTVNADGTFDYETDGSFDPTPLPSTGATNTPAFDTFSYTLVNGGTATVTITITGIDTDDLILGSDGNDDLSSDGGADEMDGGLGNDIYRINSAAPIIIEAADGGNDRVIASASYVLNSGAFVETMETVDAAATTAINLTGNSAAQAIFGNEGANQLNGGGGRDRLVGNGGNDVLNGGGGHDELEGGAGSDTLEGGNSGHDVLDGGAGADTMVGGTQNDTYIVDNVGDTVVEQVGGGSDTVESSVTYTLSSQVDVLRLTGTDAIDGTGNSVANILYGNSAANRLTGGGGNDTIRGGNGADRLFGGAGSDLLVGNGGSDRYYFNTALGASNVDSIQDFNVAVESMYLSRNVFTALGGTGTTTLAASAFRLGTTAGDANDRILYDQANGNVFYDRDGTGGAAPILFVTVADGTPLTNADFMVYG